jgi:molybdopterin/thiamine biosynthesis adenylyltransferase/rhodanese-related sulfurtransferase
MATKNDLLSQARKDIPEVSVEDVRHLVDRKADLALVDVREQSEFDEGYLPGATFIPRGFLELRIEDKVPKDADVVVYCAGGTRSLLAGQTLRTLGYTRVRSMAGGFTKWKDAGHPWQKPVKLSADDRARYARHLIIPEVGEAGQLKLLQSKVLCIGAGALGSPNGFYLAAAGVGTIGIIDNDVVDESNLQRQILHTTDRVGMWKTESAKKTVNALNPGVNVIEHRVRLTRENALEIFAQYDLIVDGSDNFSTRYLVNDACLMLQKPNVHGSIYRFEGQVTSFVPGPNNPSYRCLFPEPPPPEFAPSCQEAGVLGVVPGIIGSLQAVEAIKILLGVGKPLIGRLLHYDALNQEFRTLKYRKDPDAVVSWNNPPTELPEYSELSCAMPVRQKSA